MTTLVNIIKSNRTEIVAQWLVKCLDVYPEDSRKFFTDKKNQFANPVGDALKKSVTAFVDGLAGGDAPETLAVHLDEVVQMRAVQQMAPSEALAFVFSLKPIVARIASKGAKGRDLEAPLGELTATMEATALHLFDRFLGYRERVYELRANDVKRRVSYLLKKTSFFNNDEVPNADLDGVNENPEPGGRPGR